MDSTSQLTPERVLRRLEWQVLRRLDGRLQGAYRTLFRGTGLDFLDLREYEPGDDMRHIDWNVTARTDVPFVRQYVEDRDVTAWLLLDRSASMTFGPAGHGKDVVLTDLAGSIARLLTRGGNRVGAVLWSAGVDVTIPPRHGRDQVLVLLHQLLRERPVPHEATDLGGLLHAGLGMVKTRSMVIVVSDFITRPGWEAPLTLLARRHDVMAIRLVDPRESELPEVGDIVVEDPETGEQVMVDTADPEFRARLAELSEEFESALTRAMNRSGVDLHTVSTDEDLVGALARMAALRKGRRR